jgi:uncharacterized protein (TIGR03435 family)
MSNRIVLVIAALVSPFIEAQPTPGFEVASIKQCDGGDLGARSATVRSSPGRLNLTCQTVRALIERAYINYADGRTHVWPPQVSIQGGQAWINSARYRIEAKPESPQNRGTMNGPMLQRLLEDRFKLKVHRETKEVPVYMLSVAKGGAKLQPFHEGSCKPFDFDKPPHLPRPGEPDPLMCGISEVTTKGYKLYRTTMADFATEFAARLDRPVIDKTGIEGMLNIDLDLSANDLSDSAPSDPFAMFDAVRTAVRKLGLRIEPAKGPGEFLVIDRVERPSGQ